MKEFNLFLEYIKDNCWDISFFLFGIPFLIFTVYSIWFITDSFWFIVVGMLIWSFIFSMNVKQVSAFLIGLLLQSIVFIVILVFRYDYIEKHLDIHVTDMKKVHDVRFVDSSKTVSYKKSKEDKEYVSENLGESYFEQKSKYLQIDSKNFNDGCYLVDYQKTYSDFYKTNSTDFECQNGGENNVYREMY